MNKKRSLIFSIVRGAAAIGIALLVATLLIFASSEGATFGERGAQTLSSLRQLLIGPIFRNNGSLSTKNLCDVLASMIPIVFTGLATCVMFSANQFNLGAEGGIMLGAFVTALVAIYFPLPAGLLPVVAILIGAAAVGVMMLIPAVLKAKLGVSEMVNSLMLNYVVMYLIKFLLNSRLADKSKGQVQTHVFQDQSLLPQLIENGSKLSWGFVIAMICVVLTALFMYRTRWGYSIRMIGINQEFAKYSGMKVAGIVVLSQVLGGVLAGMGGGIEMLGRYTAFDWTALPGYGWTGVTVAILAGNNPAYVPLAAFFMAYLDKGCSLMSTYANVPSQLIDIIQAVIFLFFAAEQFLSHYRQRLVVKSAEEELKEKEAAEASTAEGSAK
jgi:ABC-type uncharacterized transport system permease subunit